MKNMYIDTCIWLNLFKKEGNKKKGKPYWLIAKNFFETYENLKYSGIILKELQFVLNDDIIFNIKKRFLKDFFEFVKVTPKDYELARILEKKNILKLSFYDYLHIAICKNNNFVLITRDKDMIKVARKYIEVKKPEYVL